MTDSNITSEKNASPKKANSAANQDVQAESKADATPDPELIAKLAEVRSQVRESFGKMVMAMMALPRYRHLPISDLQHFVLEPLIRDRVAMAYPADQEQNALMDITGMAIWASVSEEVDAKISEQIKGGVFPLRLAPEDWQSGETNWLLDVIAPDRKSTLSVISNFGQVVKSGQLKLHPLVTRLVDKETLEKMGAERMGGPSLEEKEV